MKILFVGDLNAYSRTRQRQQALVEMRHDVVAIPTAPNGFTPGVSPEPSIWERLSHRLGYPVDDTGANKEILCALAEQPFDLLWLERSLTIRPETLRKAQALRPLLRIVSYTEDNMFLRHNQSAHYRRCLPLFDWVITTKSRNRAANELPALGARRVLYVGKAFDRHTHRPLPLSAEERQRYGGDVGFVGTFERERAEDLLWLARAGIPVRVWGNGWGAWVKKHSALRVENRPIFQHEYVKAMCATRVNLCFLRKKNLDMHTDRSVEIPATASFMLAERTEEHLQLFREGAEASFFSSREELAEKVHYYLAHEDERLAIAEAGKTRCLKSGYSHHERLTYMLREISQSCSL